MEYKPEAEERKDEPPTADLPPKSSESKAKDAGYTDKLEGRLREMAGRLHELESYKLLCERKILELSPGQPLPIKTSHLGKGRATAVKNSKLDQSTQLLQQKLDKLAAENRQLRLTAAKKTGPASGGITDEEVQGLVNKVDTLEKEKSGLEESLRGEMLVSEEQRNYIEILKEALEAKIEDLGLAQMMEQAKGKDGETVCDVFAKLATMKKDLDEKRKDVTKTEGDVADMEGLIVDLKKQTDEQRDQLQQLHENYAKALKDKDEAAKLLEEINQKAEKLQKDNDALLDYAEETEEYKKNAETQLAQLKDQCEKLSAELNDKGKKVDAERTKAQTYPLAVDTFIIDWHKRARSWRRTTSRPASSTNKR